MFIGTELSSIVDLVLLLVAGIYLNVKTFPLLKYISFFFYANETVAINFWLTINEIKCSDNPEFACFNNGTAVLESLAFGTSQSVVYFDYMLQIVVTIITHVLAFMGVRRIVRKTAFY